MVMKMGDPVTAEHTVSLEVAKRKVTELKMILEPLTEKLFVAGSVRRGESRIGDIDFVCIPKFKEVANDLFGKTEYINRVVEWANSSRVKERYRTSGGDRLQKLTYNHVPVEIYMTTPQQFGRMLAIRTGPESYTKKMAARWVQLGYHGINGELISEADPNDKPEFPTEEHFFKWLCWTWVKPEARQ